MDRNVIKEIRKKYNGNEYNFPLGVKSENIENPEKIVITFNDEKDTEELPQSGSEMGSLFSRIRAWLSRLGTAAFLEVSTSRNVSEEGKYVADAVLISNMYDKIEKKMDLSITKQKTVTEFTHGMTGSVSLVKFGKIVIVTAAISTIRIIEQETILFEDNSIIPSFGVPLHDFTCAMTGSIDDVPLDIVGTMSIHPDTGLRVAFPTIGQYDGTFVYCVR